MNKETKAAISNFTELVKNAICDIANCDSEKINKKALFEAESELNLALEKEPEN